MQFLCLVLVPDQDAVVQGQRFSRGVGSVLRPCVAGVTLMACPYYLQERFVCGIFTLEEITRSSGNAKWFLE